MFPRSLKLGLLGIAALSVASTPVLAAKDIIHDAEHYVLLAKHGEAWADQDKEIEKVIYGAALC